VYAAGDVARWRNQRYGVAMRIEHRTNAIDQAWHVAEQIVSGDRAPYTPVPYFWSDQFGLRMQAHGYLRGHEEVRVIEGSLEAGRMIALYRRGDRLTGVVSVGAAKAARMWRGHLDDRMSWRDALASI
jgi:NADPH-dependent 2,4-dienoyl-CoA reductase/sulfur reductase-like enzyme